MQADHLSRYVRLMSSLAREGLDAADAAPTRADAPGYPARLGIPAARILLEPGVHHGDAMEALGSALSSDEARYNDTLGFSRPVYHPLLFHLWLQYTGDPGKSVRHPEANPRHSPHLALWWALCDYESGLKNAAREAADAVTGNPGEDGALHPRGLDDQLDAWTWRELSGLHALVWLAQLDQNEAWWERIHEIAEHHQRATQPDYTTYQPWGIAAFVLTPGTRMFADQQLHDARTNLHLEGGGAGLLPGLLLADAVALLRRIDANRNNRQPLRMELTVPTSQAIEAQATTRHTGLKAWVERVAELTTPEAIHWADGSPEEYQKMLDLMVEGGTAEWLDAGKKPNSILVRSDPADVARVEDRTFICSEKEEDAGPTNNWKDPEEMKGILMPLFKGCMKGRTMYVVPFSMGPVGSPIAHVGVELTDSAYVVANMHIMTRVGQPVLDVLGDEGDLRPLRPLRRLAARTRGGRRALGRATPTTSTLLTSPRPRRSGPSARATAATPCSARSVSPCASPRSWPASRVGWPNTCSSSSSPVPRASSSTSRPRSPRPAARPTSP